MVDLALLNIQNQSVGQSSTSQTVIWWLLSLLRFSSVCVTVEGSVKTGIHGRQRPGQMGSEGHADVRGVSKNWYPWQTTVRTNGVRGLAQWDRQAKRNTAAGSIEPDETWAFSPSQLPFQTPALYGVHTAPVPQSLASSSVRRLRLGTWAAVPFGHRKMGERE